MAETLLRQWTMLRMIPRYPRKIDGASIERRLRDDGIKVSRRSIQRDLHGLAETFPISCDEVHKPYGWSWAKDAEITDLPGMDAQTALTFKLASTFLPRVLPRSTVRVLDPHFKRADAVLQALPGNPLKAWPEKVRVLSRGMPVLAPTVRPDVLDVAYTALLEDRRFRCSYLKRGADAPRAYDVNPLAIVYRDAVAYLVCTVNEHTNAVMFVLHRMQSAELLATKRAVPKGFVLDEFIAKGAFGFLLNRETFKLSALLRGDAVVSLHEAPIAQDQVVREHDDGRVLLEATVADNLELRTWLLGFGDAVEVLGPARLRAELGEVARKMAERYGREPGKGPAGKGSSRPPPKGYLWES